MSTRPTRPIWIGICGIALLLPALATAATLKVGPNETYKSPSQAYRVAKDGDAIDIAAGEYVNDPICVTKSDLTFRGVGGYAHFKAVPLPGEAFPPNAPGRVCTGKGTFVVKGNNTTFENIEVSGAKVSDRNGAGIRLEGVGLTVRNSSFQHNQNGILGGKGGTVTIENSDFGFNGEGGGGFAHGVYFSRLDTLVIRNSYFHDTIDGHNVKTRSRTTYIYGSRITDEGGNPSYDIDISGGRAYIVGNIVEKSAMASNGGTVLNFYTNRDPDGPHELYVINNTMLSSYANGQRGAFVRVLSAPTIGTFAKVMNNIFAGAPGYVAVTAPNAQVENNLRFPKIADASLANAAAYDFRLTPDSEAINAGVDPGSVNGVSLMPITQYVHPANGEERKILGPALDIGAYEFAGNPKRLYPLPNLSISSKQSTADSSSTLAWDSNADSCVASGGAGSEGWAGAKPVKGTSNTGPIARNTVYTLACTGKGGTASQSVTVTPPAPPTIIFAVAGKMTSVPKGTGAYFSWVTTNAATCRASGAWTDPVGLTGVYDTKALAESKTFGLTCIGLSGSAVSQSIDIGINAPVLHPAVSPAFVLKAEPGEVSDIANNAVVTPSMGPKGTIVIRADKKTKKSGVVEFLPTQGGHGVHFGPGGQQSKTAGYYQFALAQNRMKPLLDEAGGEMRATLVGRWDMQERVRAVPAGNNGHHAQTIFSATDGVKNSVALLAFDTWGKSTIFQAMAPGATDAISFSLTSEFADALLGSGVSLRVRLAWNGSTQYLYLNDNLVASGEYIMAPIAWGTGSMFTIGTATSVRYGPGFRPLMDLLDDFSLFAADGSAPPL